MLCEPGGVSRRAHLEAEMDSLVVVVKDGHRNRFMEPRQITMSVQVAKLQLEVTEPPHHEAIAMQIYYYNHHRIHSALRMSPATYAARLKERDKVFVKGEG